MEPSIKDQNLSWQKYDKKDELMGSVCSDKKRIGRTGGDKRTVTDVSTNSSPSTAKSAKIFKSQKDMPSENLEAYTFCKTMLARDIAEIIKEVDIKPSPGNEINKLFIKIYEDGNKSLIDRADIEADEKPEWFQSSLLWRVLCLFDQSLRNMQVKDKTGLNRIMDKIKETDPWLDLIMNKNLWPVMKSTSGFGLGQKSKTVFSLWARHSLSGEGFKITKTGWITGCLWMVLRTFLLLLLSIMNQNAGLLND